MEITGKTLNDFRKDFVETMSALEEKYDVTITLGKITYWDDHLEFTVPGTNVEIAGL